MHGVPSESRGMLWCWLLRVEALADVSARVFYSSTLSCKEIVCLHKTISHLSQTRGETVPEVMTTIYQCIVRRNIAQRDASSKRIGPSRAVLWQRTSCCLPSAVRDRNGIRDEPD